MSTKTSTGPSITKLTTELNQWVNGLMGNWKPSNKANAAVVRDSIHGFVRLERHETEILDTPLLQRLRYITQNGLADQLYPGLHSSRLAHSIGVLHVSQLMLDSIALSTSKVDTKIRVHVRLAALLHDVGHVLFSHMGEDVMHRILPNLFSDIGLEQYKGKERFFHKVPSGEILSFLLITTPAFENAVREHVFHKIGYISDFNLREVDMELVGNMIIGKTGHMLPHWTTGIINGSFDADKLDYLIRDCYHTGVRAEVDTSRLIHSLQLCPQQAKGWEGVLSVSGVSLNYLEQIMLAKLTLYVSIYHHHKVRAIECMFKSVFDELPTVADQVGRLVMPTNCVDFLNLSEFDFWSKGIQTPEVQNLVKDLRDRRILKRCLVLDRTTVEKRYWPQLGILADELDSNPGEAKEIRDAIFALLPRSAQIDPAKLWIDIPQPPDVDKEAQSCPVLLSQDTVRPMSELMPADDWVKTYIANKLRGHIFYIGDLQARTQVAAAAERVLQDRYQLQVNSLARAALK